MTVEEMQFAKQRQIAMMAARLEAADRSHHYASPALVYAERAVELWDAVERALSPTAET